MEEKKTSFGQTLNAGLGMLEVATSASLLPFRVPGSFGRRFFSGVRALGVFAPVVSVALCDDHPGTVATAALYLPLAGLAIHRIAGMKKRSVGPHSQYDGDPLFLPKGEDADVYKGRTEPLMLVAVGMVMSTVSVGLFRWFILAAIGQAIAHKHCQMRYEAATQSICDAQIEANIVQRLHERRQ